jgi:cation:H+ antiporter
MVIAVLVFIAGFFLLLISADRFVDGAAAAAKHAGMPPLLIGIIIVGFGTSAPEMLVSAIAALEGKPELALGNAYGSNIANIALVLGFTAIFYPITVQSKIVRRELPLLLGLGLFSGWQLWDGMLSRLDASILIVGLIALIAWSAWSAKHNPEGDALEPELKQELDSQVMGLKVALFKLFTGLTVLIFSSFILIESAVYIAEYFGVSDLVIGLTVVALGTSLPELAATMAAVRKGDHNMAIGNIIGSCLFNLLAVVGIAGVISPMPVIPEVMSRDWPTMFGLIICLCLMAWSFRGTGRINRFEGIALCGIYIAYNTYLGYTSVAHG